MSKVGNQPIKILPQTSLEITEFNVKVTGPHGVQDVPLARGVVVTKNDDTLIVSVNKGVKGGNALHGLFRTLVNNAILGVVNKWEKDLEIVGTGYKCRMAGADLVLDVGYSHSVVFKTVPGITLSVDGNKIKIAGIRKEQVGQIAHKIKIIRKPDPYKGKGVRYLGEKIKLKLGKKAKAVGGGK